jgi:hypothetical protein
MDGTQRLRSLYEMLQVYADRFVEAGTIAFDIRARFSGPLHPPQSLISDDSLDWLKDQLTTLQADCEAIELHTTARLIGGFWLEYQAKRPTCQQTEEGLIVIMNAFKAELGTHVFMHVLPHRVRYWSTEAEVNSPTGRLGTDLVRLLKSLDSFPNARHDAMESGNCIAYGLNTAAVYHLMRCAEFGLVSVAKSVNVPDDKLAQGWDKCIQGIHSEIKKIESTTPTADWKDQTKKLSDLCSWFTAIRTGWRNPVSHIPRIYSENSATAISLVQNSFSPISFWTGCDRSGPPPPEWIATGSPCSAMSWTGYAHAVVDLVF